jgi:predicted amidophosphoribosyltransferase
MPDFAPARCPCGYPWKLCPRRWDAFICAACGARQDHNTIRCEECGRPLVFLSEAASCPLVVDRERLMARRHVGCAQPQMDPAIKLVDQLVDPQRLHVRL